VANTELAKANRN